MAAEPYLYWEPGDYGPDHEPDIGEEEEAQPRDPVVDQAKDVIRAFFDQERTSIFYKQQLEVIFEDEFFHRGYVTCPLGVGSRRAHSGRAGSVARFKRLKKSRATLHALRFDSDPLFDESPLVELAQADPDSKLFRWSRQYMDVIIKRYGALAGLHPSKLHFHTLKHSICVLLWQETHDLNAIRDHVGHRSSSSTLVYLRADAAQKAQSAITGMSFGVAL